MCSYTTRDVFCVYVYISFVVTDVATFYCTVSLLWSGCGTVDAYHFQAVRLQNRRRSSDTICTEVSREGVGVQAGTELGWEEAGGCMEQGRRAEGADGS